MTEAEQAPPPKAPPRSIPGRIAARLYENLLRRGLSHDDISITITVLQSIHYRTPRPPSPGPGAKFQPPLKGTSQ